MIKSFVLTHNFVKSYIIALGQAVSDILVWPAGE